MPFTTLIEASMLFEHLNDPDWVVADCRYSLEDPEKGRKDYQEAHIPGAVYAHVDEDLSGPVIRGRTGRHPLPAPAMLAQRFSSWGIGERVQVIAYDDKGGAMAARLRFLLRWLGHQAVAVLDGGWPQWVKYGYSSRRGVETRPRQEFDPHPRPELIVTTDQVVNIIAKHSPDNPLLFDSRAPERYRGEQETIDPVAGHIPTATSAPYAANLTAEGRFLPIPELRARFEKLLAETPPEQAVFYCGSGVTAAHNLLALAHAGMGEARLYAGSWSEWITDPSRPISTGNPDQPTTNN
ncbi:MAG: sulfurtransferase [Chloroflexota bacterium]